MKKILISGYTGLGNYILKTPLFNEINNNGYVIDIIGDINLGIYEVTANKNIINQVINVPKKLPLIKKFQYLFALKKKNYKFIFLPFDSTPTFVLILSNILLNKSVIVSHISKYENKKNYILKKILSLIFNMHLVEVEINKHEIDLNLDLLQNAIGELYVFNKNTYIKFNKNSEVNVIKRDYSKYIVIQPSAANGAPTPKTWDPRNFTSFIQMFLAENKGYTFVLVGDAGDLRSLGEDLPVGPNIVNMIGKTTLLELMDVLKGACLVICHDSGVMHLADGLGCNLIALYGPTDYLRTRPLKNTSLILQSEVETKNILNYKNYTEERLAKLYPNYYCMSGIRVEDLFRTAISMLNLSK